MEVVVIVMVVISAFLHSLWNFIVKKGQNKIMFTWLTQVTHLFILLIPFIYILSSTSLSKDAWFFIIASGLFITLYTYFLSKAYIYGDLSLTYPVIRSSIIFLPFLAYFLIGERISTQAIIGICIILLGIFLIHLKKLDKYALKSLFKNLKNKGTLFALLAALATALYSITDKVAVDLVSPLLYFYLIFSCSSIFYYILFLRKPFSILKKEWLASKGKIITCSFLDICSYLLILFAFQLGSVSSIIALRQLSVLFGVLLGIFTLRESAGMTRISASIIMLVGFVLVALG